MWNRDLVRSNSRGSLFVISAPAGAGKTTLVRRLVATFPNVVQVPSLTTRMARRGEVNGDHYHFISREEFWERVARDEVLEYVELHGNLYGTSRSDVESVLASGVHAILVIDTTGALAIPKTLEPVLIFIKPPSLEALRERMMHRGSEDAHMIDRRIEHAKRELADEVYFDYGIVNDNVEKAFDVLASILVAESYSVRSQAGTQHGEMEKL